MNDKLILPLYFSQNRRWSKFNIYDLKWLIIFLIVLSTLAVYILFINLPSEMKSSVNLEEIFIPDIHDHAHNQQDQHPEPPIEKLNKNDNEDVHKDHNHKKIPLKTEKTFIKETTHKIKVEPLKDDENTKRRDKVKEMTNFAWNNYVQFAWGQNELKPISKMGHSAGIFGASTSLGATIVDALDTLYIQGNIDAYNKGREWIENNFHFTNIDSDVSAFEINIRFIGGLLSLYSLTNDTMFLNKAKEVADALMPIFNSPTGLPYALVNPQRKSVQNYNWASGGCSILAELGTLSLEFQYLSDASGVSDYSAKIKRIQTVLNEVQKDDGLYYNYINPKSGTWCMKHASIGALGDSFYEYLLKLWLYSNKSDDLSLKMYLESMDAIRKNMLDHSQGGLTYIGEFKSGRIDKKMDHLACFIGGLFALTAMHVPLQESDRQVYTELAANITHTCHESYARTPTKIGPEAFHFERLETEAQAIKSNERYYILRPEVIEGYFYLWRLTKQQKYRDWAWEAVEAIEKHCRTENGFSGIRDVYEPTPQKDDVQQSFFLAETLKYLYLTFSDDNVISLNDYVFNTEAHPIRIRK